jgi:hypothetical protein
MSIEFGRKYAGLICIGCGNMTIHLIVRRSHWQLGYAETWYDGPFRSFGLGPLMLVAWY